MRVSRQHLKPLPEFFCEERHKRMQQAEQSFVNGKRRGPVFVLAGGFAKLQLFDFEVPVAEIVPGEMPEFVSCFVVSMLLECSVNESCDSVQPRIHPTVFNVR